jgi:oxalate---CoA ligase
VSDQEPRNFWKLFSALAATSGDVQAIVAPGRPSLRFADVPLRLEAIRDALHGFGITRGDRVVVVLPRGPEMAFCFLGVAACATVVPLNPQFTEDEFHRYLSRLRPTAVIAGEGHGRAIRSVASMLGIEILELTSMASGPAGAFKLDGRLRPAARPPEWADEDDIAVVLLTSGTTSAQKLVPLRHRHLIAYARGAKTAFGLGSDDRCLHVVPMFHSQGLKSSLLWPLAAGGGVICPAVVDVPSIFDAMATLQPTWYTANPTLHQAILDAADQHREILRRTNLRFILAGAGRLDPKIMRGLEDAFGVPVIEGYSMSETGKLTANPLPPRVRKRGTVGVPLYNEVRIIDESGAAVGPGQQGEVVARGPSVFDGYLDDPHANAEAFVDGWFRTGDLGWFDDDGYLTLTGRIKDVINRGGEKIGALEVERVLCDHPAVGRACVFGIPHPTLGEEVVASVIPAALAQASEEAIRAFARQRLAPFKVPRRIFFTTAFPTGASGKIDKRQLARLGADLLAAPSDAAARRDAAEPSVLEAEVAALWHSVLGERAASVDRDFFLSGGDSLKAVELFAAIQARFGVELDLRHIFDAGSTVAGLADLIERERAERTPGPTLPVGLIPLKTDGARPPLFGVPPNGEPACFMDLARLLDPEQPLYGLRARGVDGQCRPLSRLGEIAADHVATIRALPSRGARCLMGVCLGGLVAQEMARQLEASGEPVALLVLLDPAPPFTDLRGRPRRARAIDMRLKGRMHAVRFLLARLRLYAHELVQTKGERRVAFLREKLRLFRAVVGQHALLPTDPREFYLSAVFDANRAAARRHVPGVYRGRTLLCFSTDLPVAGSHDHRLDWLSLLPDAAVQWVPGRDSGDMLKRPQILTLAQHVNAWLAQSHAAMTSDKAPPSLPTR